MSKGDGLPVIDIFDRFVNIDTLVYSVGSGVLTSTSVHLSPRVFNLDTCVDNVNIDTFYFDTIYKCVENARTYASTTLVRKCIVGLPYASGSTCQLSLFPVCTLVLQRGTP